MPEKKGARLDFDERWEIEDMLKESSPFREIARKLGVSPTTVSSEVKLNRAFFKPKAMQSRTLRRRPNSASCRSACRCRLRHGRSMRDKAQPCRSPGTSSSATAPSPAPKGGASARRLSARSAESATYCTFEKVQYVASRAQAAHDARLRGLCRHRLRTELKDMVGKVKGLLAQGQSI